MSKIASETQEIACTLTNEEYKKRRTSIRQDLWPHLINASLQNLELVLEFTNNESMRQQVEHFIWLERQCCGFLTFNISPQGKPLILSIIGPEGSQSTLAKAFKEANSVVQQA